MRKGRALTFSLGFVIGLLVAGLFFWGIGLRFFSSPSVEEEGEPGGGGRMFVSLPQYYRDDQAAREELFRINGLGLPAVARVVRMDVDGTWSRISLGPFATSAEAAAAARRLNDGPSEPPAETPSVPDEEDEPDKPRPLILVELTALVGDEDIFDELEFPRQRNIYAFAHTAEVTAGENGRALNRLYLGPFASDAEALETLGRLRDWPLAADFSLRRLESGDE